MDGIDGDTDGKAVWANRVDAVVISILIVEVLGLKVIVSVGFTESDDVGISEGGLDGVTVGDVTHGV